MLRFLFKFLTRHSIFFLLIIVCFTSCNQTFRQKVSRNQAVDLRFPYKEQNLSVISEKTQSTAEMAGEFAGGMARSAKVAIDSIKDGFNGKTKRNPYDRGAPFKYDDYKRRAMGDLGREIMAPLPSSEMLYPTALRAPFQVDTENISLTPEAIAFQRHLDQLNALIDEAEALSREKDFEGALEKIREAMELDPSSERAKNFYAIIVRAQEREGFRAEMERREAEALAEQERIETAEEMRIKQQKAQMISEMAIRVDRALEREDIMEAKRLAEAAYQIDSTNEMAQQMVDNVEFIIFQQGLDPRMFRHPEIMEDVILEHLNRYQEYESAGLEDLARRELRKITFLESLKTR